MQNVFLSPKSGAFTPSAPYIVPNIRLLQEMFLQKSRPIIFSRHITDVTPTNMMNKWWNDPIKVEDKNSEISASLDTSTGIVVQKHQYSALRDTPIYPYQ